MVRKKMLEKNKILKEILIQNISQLSKAEDLDESVIKSGILNGTMVLLKNPNHKDCIPTLIGQPASIKVNANLGTSPFLNDLKLELSKLKAAEKAGAHTVMDLSTGGDLDHIRKTIISETSLPVGTVPIYSVAQKYILKHKDPSCMSTEEIFEEIEKQAEQGVDFMTLHCGVTERAVRLVKEGKRVLGIVSRGGSILAKWIEKNKKENPLLTNYERLLKICLKHNVVISLGDGLRPGAGCDAGDMAQWEEVIVLGELSKKAKEYGVQTMIEGPGHVPIHLIQSQIQGIKRICNGAPLYVLGPLTTDIAPGYDHIAGAIGGALAGFFGADFLCYITPAEHLTLPNENDVWIGVKASLIAAHSAEVALGRRKAVEKDYAISLARSNLEWEKIASLAIDPDLVKRRRERFASKKECAMCGEFCAVKLLK